MTSTEITKSLFNLINYNYGKFKSEKQAALFNSIARDGEIVVEGGNVYGNKWNWQFIIDSTGIQAVNKTKVTKAGDMQVSQYWNKDNAEAFTQARNEKKAKSAAIAKQEEMDHVQGMIDEIKARADKINQFLNDPEKIADSSESFIQTVTNRQKTDAEELRSLMQKLQDIENR